jgi:hypothetical protein
LQVIPWSFLLVFGYLKKKERQYLEMNAEEEEEEYHSDNEAEEDPKDPATMMMNLEIAGSDVFDDPTNSNAARIAASTIITQQVSFYVACALRGFYNRLVPAAPTILVYGGGLIGQRVIDSLVGMKCGEMLYIYTRGDLRAKYWRSKGLKSSPSMARLLKGNKADVVILLAGMSSFQNMSKLLMNHITRSTCIINAAFGIERRRFFAILRTPSVFRTYVEPQYLIDLINSNPELQYLLKEGRLGMDVAQRRAENGISSFDVGALHGANNNNNNNGEDEEKEKEKDGNRNGSMASGTDYDPHASTVMDESVMMSIEMEESHHQSTVLDSIMTFAVNQVPPLEGTEEGTIEYAADLVAQRCRDIKDQIYQWENYYAIIGVKHRQARTQALVAVLGFDPDEFNTDNGSSSVGGEGGSVVSSIAMGERGLDSPPPPGADGGDNGPLNSPPAAGSDNGNLLEEMLRSVKVQSYDTLVGAMSELEMAVSVHFRRQFSKYIRLVDIPSVQALADNTTFKRAKSRRRRPKSQGGGDSNLKDGLGDVRDDGANDEDEEERNHAQDMEGAPIHLDSRIKRILAFDGKLSGHAKAKAGSLIDEFSQSVLSLGNSSLGDMDDMSSVMSVGGESIGGGGGNDDGGIHLPNLGSAADEAKQQQQQQQQEEEEKLRQKILDQLPAADAYAGPSAAPRMMANPVIQQGNANVNTAAATAAAMGSNSGGVGGGSSSGSTGNGKSLQVDDAEAALYKMLEEEAKKKERDAREAERRLATGQ